MLDVFAGLSDSGFGFLLTPEQRLLDAIREGNYPRAYSILRGLEKPLEGDTAADCLIASFSRTDKLFIAVLEQLSPEVRYGRERVQADDGSSMEVRGSLLVLAAALGMAVHVRALLAKGFDVNAAESGYASLLPEQFRQFVPLYDPFYGPQFRYCATPGNEVTITAENGVSLRVMGCTPLAAAIAAGNPFTMDALLETPGVWKTESSAVCRAAAIHADGRSHNRDWRLLWPDSPFGLQDLGETLFTQGNMQPASFVDFCSTELLKKQYAGGFCTEADARAVLDSLGNRCNDHWAIPFHLVEGPLETDIRCRAGKLLLTAKHFPAVCGERKYRNLMLQTYVSLLRWGKASDALRKCWMKFSGKDRDISAAAGIIFSLNQVQRKACLEALTEGGTLYASADALLPDTVTELREMVKYIRILPSPFRTGISGFARSVLNLSPESRLLRKLFQSGVFAREPREALLRAADLRMRPLILTSPSREPEETYDPLLTRLGFFHDTCTPEEERGAAAQRILSGDMGEADCLMYLSDPQIWAAITGIDCLENFPQLADPEPYALLICAKNLNALRAWMRLHPSLSGATIRSSFRDAGALTTVFGTPLTLAAAAGSPEHLALLLEAGMEPNTYTTAWVSDKQIPCSPLLLALWFEREAAARMLLEVGAVCRLDQGYDWFFFRKLPPEGRALAARLSVPGFREALDREAAEAGSEDS